MGSSFIAIIIEFTMGTLIGILDQGEGKITVWEGLLAAAAFVGINLVTYAVYPESSIARMSTGLFIGWIAVWVGLFTGNAARHDLRNYFLSSWYESLAKRELQVLIAEFLRLSSRLVYFNSLEDQKRLVNIVGEVDQQLKHILNKFAMLEGVTDKFSRIREICHLYYELSQTIIETQGSAEIIAEWTKLGDHLEQVSTHSLCYAEDEIRRHGDGSLVRKLI
ncbi:MAG: hypothetical protein ABFD08_14675 [Syntrophomonas sp.]